MGEKLTCAGCGEEIVSKDQGVFEQYLGLHFHTPVSGVDPEVVDPLTGNTDLGEHTACVTSYVVKSGLPLVEPQFVPIPE